MACVVCKYCDKFVDLDWNVEHGEEEHDIPYGEVWWYE